MKKAMRFVCLFLAGLMLLLSASCRQEALRSNQAAQSGALSGGALGEDGYVISDGSSLGTAVPGDLGNMRYADSSFVAGLDSRFETAKNAILTSPNTTYTATGEGKVYYVSSSEGNDANDGLSPQTPWKTIGKVNSEALPAGSVILFKRGDEWNREGRLNSKSNVTFSAYGEGAKPVFSWYIDASNTGDWENVGGNLYVYAGAYESGTPYDYDGKDISADHPNLNNIPGSYLTSTDYDCDDIGNIIFNDDEGWGVKITKKNATNESVALGTVPTGFGYLTHHSGAFENQNDLSQHLEFYHNSAESRLYLYCEGGNPAEVFKNIKLVLKEYLFFGATADVCHDVTLDNLAFKYTGCHGVSLNQCVNVTIQNCEIAWCGGSIQEYTFGEREEPTRFGEGIQNWGNCNNFKVLNNYIHQIYDGATSSQQSADENLQSCLVQNVEVSENCYENNSQCIEFWMDLTPTQGGDSYKFKDWDISDNLMRKAGYGFGATRPAADVGAAVFFNDSLGMPKPNYENVKMSKNTAWGSREGIVGGLGWNTAQYNLVDNVFVQEYGGLIGKLAKDFDNIVELKSALYKYDTTTIAMLLGRNIFGQNTFYYTYPTVERAPGGGTVSPIGSGVYYTFDGLKVYQTNPEGLLGTTYKTNSGMVLYNWNNQATLTADADGNLQLKHNAGANIELTFIKDFSYPKHPQHGNFFDISAVSIRYKILNNQNYVGTNQTLTIHGGAGSAIATSDAFPIPQNDVWIETVLPVSTGDDANKLGWWGKTPNYMNHKIVFPELTSGSTIVIDYIGLYHSEAEARLAQVERNAKHELIGNHDAVKLSGAQTKTEAGDKTVRFVGVIDNYNDAAYSEFGFKIKVNGKTATAKIENYVYNTVLENGNPKEIPASFVTGQGENTKYFTFCVRDIPESACTEGKLTFEVCSYAKINDADICGPTAVFEYDYANQTVKQVTS